MPSPILARADALMQRRRQANEFDGVPVLTDAIDDEDDIPVLIDAEVPMQLVEHGDDSIMESPVESNQAIPEPTVLNNAVFDSAMRETLAHELAHRVQQRITAELPRIIESTLRDFLAEQEMISALTSRD
ncbi:MAG: hypothetical protein IPP59_10300 [Betaproteobacteria bacterium]|nr:hypothetical protein [Candidatus Dechloromonas phosphorivorans]